MQLAIGPVREIHGVSGFGACFITVLIRILEKIHYSADSTSVFSPRTLFPFAVELGGSRTEAVRHVPRTDRSGTEVCANRTDSSIG